MESLNPLRNAEDTEMPPNRGESQAVKSRAEIHQIREDQIIERALDILFTLTDLFDESMERQGWSFLSGAALQRVWDNEEDAVYDNWRALHGYFTTLP
jgi:hypothetical protein